MKTTMTKSVFVAVLVMVLGCATAEDFVPPPAKPMTVIHNEPQKPALEVNEKPVAIKPATAVANETSKSVVRITDENQPVSPYAVRKVALVVQNLAKGEESVPIEALAAALTAKLSGGGLQVVNPYNAGKTPVEPAMEIARRLRAEGAVTASVLEFMDSTSDTSHQYSIRIVLNLADAWSGATVIEGEDVEKLSPYYTNDQVARKKKKLLNDLMYSAADECVAKLKKNPYLLRWTPTPPSPPPRLMIHA